MNVHQRLSLVFALALSALPLGHTFAASPEAAQEEGDEAGSDDVLAVLHSEGITLVGEAKTKFAAAMAKPENKGMTLMGRSPKPKKKYPVAEYKGSFKWPTVTGRVSSEFGPRWNRKHEGIDIAGPIGVPIRSIAPGQVLYAGDEIRGYGNCVVIQHDRSTISLYAHNDVLKVATKDKIKAGQVIALLGNSGKSTGPHLHFEIRTDGVPLDPLKKLPKARK